MLLPQVAPVSIQTKPAPVTVAVNESLATVTAFAAFLTPVYRYARVVPAVARTASTESVLAATSDVRVVVAEETNANP